MEKSWRNVQTRSSNLSVVCQENLDYWLSRASVTPNFKIHRHGSRCGAFNNRTATAQSIPIPRGEVAPRQHILRQTSNSEHTRGEGAVCFLNRNTIVSTTYRENRSGAPLSAANPNQVFDLFLLCSILRDSVEVFCLGTPESILLALPDPRVEQVHDNRRLMLMASHTRLIID